MTQAVPDGSAGREIAVSAPARLHLGFVDLNGSLGRRFGSIGLALEAPTVAVRAGFAADRVHGGVVVHDHCSRCGPNGEDDTGESSKKALHFARAVLNEASLEQSVALHLDALIPAHAGLGSGTQMALAVGLGLAQLTGLHLSPRQVAARLDRGSRSGIGLGAFEQGGFLVDGGLGAHASAPPPLIARLAFPERWRILLVRDGARRGVHGDDEKHAFEAMQHFPDEQAAHLCRVVMMRMLPALAECDAAAFGNAVSEVQQRVGDHFAHAQGGRFASPDVAGALAMLSQNGAAGVGQSSWGPTGFALCESEAQARRLAALLDRRNDGKGLNVSIHAARNSPGQVSVVSCPGDRQAPPTACAQDGASHAREEGPSIAAGEDRAARASRAMA